MTLHLRRWQRRALLAGSLAAALAVTTVVTVQAHADDSVQLITNGTFDTTIDPWFSYGTTPGAASVNGQLCLDVPAGTVNRWDVAVVLNGVTIQSGATYVFGFDASASAPAGINANVQLGDAPFTTYASLNPSLGASMAHFTTSFSSADTTQVQVVFQVGGNASAYTFCLDNVSLAGGSSGGAEQLTNGTFDAGTAPWWWTGNLAPAVTNGQLCMTVPAGTSNPWDAIVGQNDVKLSNGVSYELSFDASATISNATNSVGVLANVQLADPPYTQQISAPTTLTAALTHYKYVFTSDADITGGQVAFQIGGSAVAWTLCLDNVSLKGGVAPPQYAPETGPRVRVNQVGYLPSGPKNATLVTDATTPVAWQLKDSTSAVVASGMTTPRGMDAASGQNVASIDFSAFTTAGSGYTLTADGETSYPFTISGSIYNQLRSDALSFFYAQRSGIAIDNAILPGYGRPAGHAGVAPNQGDTSVGCQPGVCDYTLNVAGGWYDAGDQGKYVVNGGIAVAQLMSEFERTKTASAVKAGALADSTLRVPETGNKVPDILDEARWELNFLMEMQVPAGKPYAGMAFHKVHDQNWTGLPQAPDKDSQLRELHPPSTAATLNLAATAAQCARLFAPYDKAFATKCLNAAKTAYAAAKANPAMYASTSDGNGGGTYDDANVTDEFYWAAAELFITTGSPSYLADINASPWKTQNPFVAGGFGWADTAAVGRLDLATVPNLLPSADKAAVRASIVAGANAYLATENGESYGLPYAPDGYNYVWGSNSSVLNNMVVLATAYDLSGNSSYRNAVLQGMDYLLGRNALNHSFVTGYGTVSSQNQHTRIYAHELDPSLPNPPAGSISGGPNVGIQDPLAGKLLKNCKAQFCYIDDIQSYATNEVAINWNSALAWVSSFVADQGTGQPAAPAKCKVTYSSTVISGVYLAAATVTNTGSSAITGWTLSWNYTGDQKALAGIGATVSQTGAAVTATNIALNKKIPAHGTVAFAILGTASLANADPSLFLLNGNACS